MRSVAFSTKYNIIGCGFKCMGESVASSCVFFSVSFKITFEIVKKQYIIIVNSVAQWVGEVFKIVFYAFGHAVASDIPHKGKAVVLVKQVPATRPHWP